MHRILKSRTSIISMYLHIKMCNIKGLYYKWWISQTLGWWFSVTSGLKMLHQKEHTAGLSSFSGGNYNTYTKKLKYDFIDVVHKILCINLHVHFQYLTCTGKCNFKKYNQAFWKYIFASYWLHIYMYWCPRLIQLKKKQQ